MEIEADIGRGGGADQRSLSECFAKYRETLIEPARHGEEHVRNSIRPSAFSFSTISTAAPPHKTLRLL